MTAKFSHNIMLTGPFLARNDAKLNLGLNESPYQLPDSIKRGNLYREAGADMILTYFAPKVAEEVPRIITAINLVAAGQGISLVPASMRALHNESVVYRDLVKGSLPPMPLTLVFRRHDPSAGHPGRQVPARLPR